MIGDDHESWWRVWLPPILIVGSPWLVAAIAVALLVVEAQISIGPNVAAVINYANWPLAIAGSAYGSLFVRGRMPMRVAVVIVSVFYAMETYLILLVIATNVLPRIMF